MIVIYGAITVILCVFCFAAGNHYGWNSCKEFYSEHPKAREDKRRWKI